VCVCGQDPWMVPGFSSIDLAREVAIVVVVIIIIIIIGKY
jgi:hypothetical protein